VLLITLTDILRALMYADKHITCSYLP